ncbi:MAG: iron complex transport system substrate-binding protein [Gammaproteobacteria bacterium]|jgi:iron complex transport system substrate-binding protein|nr:iron complex transport system substrate-binding protein [Gammaproteobacteria bacterium]
MKILKLSVVACLLSAAFSAYAAVSVQDDMGDTITLAKPAKRVVSLSPGITETLFDIGAGKQVVGVSVDSDYPLAAAKLPQVGGFQNANIEAIVALKPDLVVAWEPSGIVPQLSALSKFNIPVYVVNNETIPNIAGEMRNLGELTGNSVRANYKAAQFLAEYHQLLNKYGSAQPQPKVFMQVSSNPIYTVSNRSMPGQIIGLCGGQNIFGSMKTYAGMVAVEEVIEVNPDVIIGLSPFTPSTWSQWNQINAVKNHNMVNINSSLIARDGPRILEGASQVCKAIAKARNQ